MNQRTNKGTNLNAQNSTKENKKANLIKALEKLKMYQSQLEIIRDFFARGQKQFRVKKTSDLLLNSV